MPANALVQTRIDAKVKARAAAVLEEIGMTVSDAVRILLTRTANEGALPSRRSGWSGARRVVSRQSARGARRPTSSHGSPPRQGALCRTPCSGKQKDRWLIRAD